MAKYWVKQAGDHFTLTQLQEIDNDPHGVGNLNELLCYRLGFEVVYDENRPYPYQLWYNDPLEGRTVWTDSDGVLKESDAPLYFDDPELQNLMNLFRRWAKKLTILFELVDPNQDENFVKHYHFNAGQWIVRLDHGSGKPVSVKHSSLAVALIMLLLLIPTEEFHKPFSQSLNDGNNKDDKTNE